MEQEILDYIELIRDAVPNAIEVFTQGNCGSLALILSCPFNGEIKDLYGHIIFEYKGIWYDITGVVETDYKYEEAISLNELGVYDLSRRLKNRYNEK